MVESNQINRPLLVNEPSIEQAEPGKMGGMRDCPLLHPFPYSASTRTVLGEAYPPSYRLSQSIPPRADPRSGPLPGPPERCPDVTQLKRDRARDKWPQR